MRFSMGIAGILASIFLAFSANAALTNTGLDQIGVIIAGEEKLERKVSPEQIAAAADAAEQMNAWIVEAIIQEGLANDGEITAADAMQINLYLVEHYRDVYASLRDDYYAIECKGARQKLLNTNAVNYVFAYVYNLGLETYDKCRMSKPGGRKGGSFKTASYYLSELLAEDLASGALVNQSFEEFAGTTDTVLDQMIELIFVDRGLNKRIPLHDMRQAARSADAMNVLILKAIVEEGLANDGVLSAADARQMNIYLVENHLDQWAELHGDDEKDKEWGYHYIQNDGATTRMFAENLFNSVLDGIYHLGFKTNKRCQLVNEDGRANKSFEKVAWWLNTILQEELASGQLKNDDYPEVIGDTGTALDEIIEIIKNDEGLQYRASTSDIRTGAAMANRMNELIVEAIDDLGIFTDNEIDPDEVAAINQYLVERHEMEWKELHGDDEKDYETGFHRIQNDGAVAEAFGKNLINTIADSIYHLGFKTPYDYRLVNEDGRKNASFKTVAYWLNRIMNEGL